MKMTIQEYYETLKAKRKGAENELEGIKHQYDKGEIGCIVYASRKGNITRTIDTYTDCICLLESSHLLDKE